MLEYYLPKSSVNIELTLLSGGTTVTGRTPTVLIRDKDTSKYFDFSSRTFTSTTVSATALLTSSIDGLYTYSWNTQGLFNNDIYLTFEYHDSTALATDDIAFVTKPSGLGGGGGTVSIKGLWTKEQKEKLIKDVETLKNDISSFREKSIELLRRILSKKTLTREDLQMVSEIKARDLKMYQELLKILNLKSDTNEKEVFKKLQEFIESEELAKAEIIEKLNKMLPPSVDKEDKKDKVENKEKKEDRIWGD